jgi:hypothetical protein
VWVAVPRSLGAAVYIAQLYDFARTFINLDQYPGIFFSCQLECLIFSAVVSSAQLFIMMHPRPTYSGSVDLKLWTTNRKWSSEHLHSTEGSRDGYDHPSPFKYPPKMIVARVERRSTNLCVWQDFPRHFKLGVASARTICRTPGNLEAAETLTDTPSASTRRSSGNNTRFLRLTPLMKQVLSNLWRSGGI